MSLDRLISYRQTSISFHSLRIFVMMDGPAAPRCQGFAFACCTSLTAMLYCTEDTFVKAMSCGLDFENERHERSWLTTTAMNICKDKLRFYLFWKSPFWCVTGIFRLNGIFPFRWLQLSGLLQNGIFDAAQRTVRVAFLLLYLFLYRKRAGSHRLFLLPVL